MTERAGPSWSGLRERVVSCRACPRLVRYRERVAVERKRAFASEVYWGRPVPGFGDPSARLLVIGLAPSAHGANRTGRMFTGDRSADFLAAALYRSGYASQPTSVRRGDGLSYTDLYLTAVARCAPPDNRPRPEELRACQGFLVEEMRLLGRLRAVLALGAIAWESALDAASAAYGVGRPRVPFAHGACAPLGEGLPLVYGSYHPSPQNTQTGKLSPAMFDELLRTIRGAYATVPGPVSRRTISATG